jgi:hypothetical protein
MLDLLTAQEESYASDGASYRQHMDRFERDPKSFLGTKNPATQLGRALKKGYLKSLGAKQLKNLDRTKK